MEEKVLNDRYKIIKELGKGGMAIVYEAQDLLLDRKVAVKMLRPEYVSDKEFVKKFRHEAQAVARISHPNVVSIFDIGRDNNYHYLVMENVKGCNLKDIIKKRGRLSMIEALDIASQICAALIVAHSSNIVHCDIKPHNILITSDKQVKVTDFGIARAVTSSSTITVTDTIMGSAHYFSPEQAKGGEINAYSDLYSAGIVLYEMLTGEVPFTGDSPISVALKHIQQEPEKLTNKNTKIPSEIEKLVMKALAKKPKQRFNSAKSMREAIIEALKILKKEEKEKTSETVVAADGDTKILKKTEINNEINRDYSNNKHQYLNSSSQNDGDDNRETGRKNWLILTVLIVVFLSLTVGGVIYVYNSYTSVPIVEVPEMIGMDIEEARTVASQVGLEIQQETESINHPEIPENKIVSQYPGAGERVRQTRDITVTVSKGSETLIMSDLLNMTLREAEILLDNKNIEIANKEFKYSNEVSENRIIEQKPGPEAEIKSGEEVVLIVSKGPRPDMVEVPNLIGLTRAEAFNRIEEANLKPGSISEELTERFQDGQVAHQEYETGEKIPELTKIDLTISKGLINEENAEVHTRTVQIDLNWLVDKRRIRIEVIDANGRNIVYDAVHKPGDNISQTVNSVGPTTFEIYSGEELFTKKQFD